MATEQPGPAFEVTHDAAPSDHLVAGFSTFCLAGLTPVDSLAEDLDLPPLYDAVDPDALDALYRDDSADVSSRLTYEGLEVVVHPTRSPSGTRTGSGSWLGVGLPVGVP